MPLPSSAPSRSQPQVQTSTARRVAVSPRQSRHPRLPMSLPWSAFFAEDAWRLYEDSDGHWHILPEPLLFRHSPGLCGVIEGHDAEGRPVSDIRPLVENQRREQRVPADLPQGGSVISCIAHGIVYDDYCRGYQSADGPTSLWFWVRPSMQGRRENLDSDNDARTRWLALAMRDLLGYEKPPADVVESLITRESREAERWMLATGATAARMQKRTATRLRSLLGDDGAVLAVPGLGLGDPLKPRRELDQIIAQVEARAGIEQDPPADPTPTPRRRS